MNEFEADRLAAQLLAEYSMLNMFEISLGDEHEYQMMTEAFARLGCRTGPDGEYFRLKVFPNRVIGCSS